MLRAEALAARRGERVLFAGLSFSLRPREALLLTGPNGSGKTTLIRLLAGFGRPLAGWLFWDGAPMRDDPEAYRARLHYVGHLDALKPTLTPLEMLRFWQSLGNPSAADPMSVLERNQLGRLASLPCRHLSSGQRRRLALSRLDLWSAPLWLLDEPSVGLDRAAIGALQDRIAAHRAAGGMIVLSSHQALALDGAQVLDLDDFPPAPVEPLEW